MSAQEKEVAGGGGAGGGGEDGHLLGQEHDLLTVPHEGKLQGRTTTENIYKLPIYLLSIQGIGVGRCGSNADLLKQLFTPHVVMVSSVSIIVIGNIILLLLSA